AVPQSAGEAIIMEISLFGALGSPISVIGVLLVVVVGLVAIVTLVLLSRKTARDGNRHPKAALTTGQPHPAITAERIYPACGAELEHDAPQGLCPQCLFQCAMGQAGQTPKPEPAVATSAHRGLASAPAVADLAQHFPQLEFIELIGQGGMGAVYKARQTKL